MSDEVKLFRYAARRSRTEALDLIATAKNMGLVDKSKFLSKAAAKLRDSDLFAGKANVAEIFADGGE